MADEITTDIARQARREDLADRTKSTTLGEIITGRSSGFNQADILARTVAEDSPYRLRAITERESTNVEDRRFQDDPVDPNAPIASSTRRMGQEGPTEADVPYLPGEGPGPQEVVQRGSLVPLATYRDKTTRQEYTTWAVPGFVQDVWDSMTKLKNGVPDVLDFNPKDTFNVAGGVTAGGYSRAVTREGVASLGAGGGRVYNSGQGYSAVKIGDDIFTGMNHSDALERASAKLGRPYDELAEVVGKAKDGEGWYIDGAYKTRQQVEGSGGTELGMGGGRVPPPRKPFEVQLTSTKGEPFTIRRDPSDPRQWTFVKDGKEVGEFAFIRDADNPNFYNIDGINVYKEKLGLGEPTYKHFMQLAEGLGDKVVPSGNLTQATRNLWEKLQPGITERGAYKLTDTPEGPRYFRSDATFSTQPQGTRVKTDPSHFPTQGVLPHIDAPMVQKVNSEYRSRAMNGMDMTAPYKGLDPSVVYSTQHMDKKVFAKATNLLQDQADKYVKVLKKEMPDLHFEVEKSGTSAYIHIKDGDKQVLKARLGDHGATGQDIVSIDPVSGNTLETLLSILRYEKGLTDVAPQIGWSYLPPEKFRTALNKQAGTNIFPRNRQIGGTAEYIRGGYSTNQRPYKIQEQTVGTDVQWRDPQLRKPLTEAAE